MCHAPCIFIVPCRVWQDQPPQQAYTDVCEKRKTPLTTYTEAASLDDIISYVFSYVLGMCWLPFFDTVID